MADMIFGNNYASTNREWHGKGTLMLPNEPLENWIARSGMDFKIGRAKVRYPIARTTDTTLASELKTLDDKVVLFRLDNGAPLGVVSDSYKVVQPTEVWEFFREWSEAQGMTLESGGLLFGGKRYFATAKLKDEALQALDGPTGRDKIKPYILLSTSADGSLATEASWRLTRVVCWNTMRMAFAEGKGEYRITHRSVFKPDAAKSMLEAANEEFGAFMETARMLAGIRVTSKKAEELYAQLLVTPTRNEDKVRESAAFKKMMALFEGQGMGATLETARETGWGWLQGVTEFVDHHARAHSDENRMVSSMWGPGDTTKDKALALILTA